MSTPVARSDPPLGRWRDAGEVNPDDGVSGGPDEKRDLALVDEYRRRIAPSVVHGSQSSFRSYRSRSRRSDTWR